MATKERIFFGSLEIKEKERLERSNEPSTTQSALCKINITYHACVNILSVQAESLAFSAKAVESQEKHKQLLQKLEQNKRARYVMPSCPKTANSFL